MPTEKSNIIRRKIETGAVYAVIGETSGDASKRVTAAVSRAFTEHYKTKSSAEPTSETPGKLGDLIAKNGENRRGFLYRIDGETDCIVLMDPAAILAAATWAHEGAIPDEPAPPTANVSTIDQRLAGMLALEIVCAINSGDDEDVPADEDQNIDLTAVGADASRFIVGDEAVSALAIGFDISTIDDAALGSVTLLLPDALLSQKEVNDDTSVKELAAKNWANSMAMIVGGTPIEARAIIARQQIDVQALSNFKLGQVISLRGASLDAVVLQPDHDIDAQSLALGAVRSFDGLRTLQISALEPTEAVDH